MSFDPTRTAGTTSRGIAYSRRGGGEPVVLVHGWCLNRGLWIYLEEQLAASHHVLALDLPGFGGSAVLEGPYDLNRMVSELDAFLAEVVGGAAVVVGFAFGAAVALSLAAEDASRLRGIVSIGVPSAAHAAYDRMPRAMKRDWPLFASRSAAAICKTPLSEPSLRWLGDMFASTPLPVALATVEILKAFEPRPVAERVKGVSVLFVHGADDPIVPPAISEECAALIPEARLELVPDSGHLVLMDQKERFGELVQGFLAGLPARSSSA